MKCSVEGCTNPYHQKGYCRPHYMRWWRHGDPLGGIASRKFTKEERGEYKRQWYQKNRERLIKKATERNQQEPVRANRARKKWKDNNLSKVRRNTIARKRNLAESTPAWLTAEQYKQMDEFYEIARTLTKNTREPYHVDHIVPLKARRNVRGLHVPWNLRVMRGEENMKRSRKTH
jgi:hypothetical protein